MPAFIRGENCLVMASNVQEIHHSGSSGGIVGVKTAVANTTQHGTVVARVSDVGINDSSAEVEKRAGKASEVAESLAAYLLAYAKAPDVFVIAFNAEKADYWEVTNLD